MYTFVAHVQSAVSRFCSVGEVLAATLPGSRARVQAWTGERRTEEKKGSGVSKTPSSP